MLRTHAIEPMTLGNMRANGVRSLLVYCTACPRTVIFNVDAYPERLPVPAFGPRMVCTGCGMIDADARPNWNENRAPGAWQGRRAWRHSHSDSSCPAKAGHPVSTNVTVPPERSVFTGSPAFAGDDDR